MHSFPENQGLNTIEKRERSAELIPLSSLSDDEQEVERLKHFVQNMVFSPSEVNLRKPSERSFISGKISGDGNGIHRRRDQTTYEYKFAGIETESV